MPTKLANAANNAPIPNQSSTNPVVKISAIMSIAPRMHQRTQNHSLIVARQPFAIFFNTNQMFAGRSASLRMK